MTRTEITVPGILKEYDKSGNVPEHMLPIQNPIKSDAGDPTKPLRGAFESVLLARIASPALERLQSNINVFPNASFYMLPLAEVDEEEEYTDKVILLRRKANFVCRRYREVVREEVNEQLDTERRQRLPRSVAFAYDELERNVPQDTFFIASETFNDVFSLMFDIGLEYPDVLKREPTAQELIELIGNSYESFVHILAARHDEVETILDEDEPKLGVDYVIDISSSRHKIAIKNPERYVKEEQRLRSIGKITDATIHCPFSTGSVFTEPFLDSESTPVEGNPMKYTFQTLVKDFIGA